jgi:hypothetical protein
MDDQSLGKMKNHGDTEHRGGRNFPGREIAAREKCLPPAAEVIEPIRRLFILFDLEP